MATRDERIALALEMKRLHGLTTYELDYTLDVDGAPLTIEGGYQQTVAFSPEAFGLTHDDITAAELIESAHITKENPS